METLQNQARHKLDSILLPVVGIHLELQLKINQDVSQHTLHMRHQETPSNCLEMLGIRISVIFNEQLKLLKLCILPQSYVRGFKGKTSLHGCTSIPVTLGLKFRC